jgi:hypothetical protein
MKILIEVSPGELVDRLTILEIKSTKLMKEPAKAYVCSIEFSRLHDLYMKLGEEITQPLALIYLREKLFKINLEIWMKREDFRETTDPYRLLTILQTVQKLNDDRALRKQQVDRLFGAIGEQKSFLE